MKQSKPFIQPYLRERKRNHECTKEKKKEFKDDIKSLDELKIERKSMQK